MERRKKVRKQEVLLLLLLLLLLFTFYFYFLLLLFTFTFTFYFNFNFNFNFLLLLFTFYFYFLLLLYGPLVKSQSRWPDLGRGRTNNHCQGLPIRKYCPIVVSVHTIPDSLYGHKQLKMRSGPDTCSAIIAGGGVTGGAVFQGEIKVHGSSSCRVVRQGAIIITCSLKIQCAKTTPAKLGGNGANQLVVLEK